VSRDQLGVGLIRSTSVHRERRPEVVSMVASYRGFRDQSNLAIQTRFGRHALSFANGAADGDRKLPRRLKDRHLWAVAPQL